MPRYALLRHVVPLDSERTDHWDLLLEHGDSCLTWALQDLPTAWQVALQADTPPHVASTDAVAAIELAPHRLHYLTYEGEVSGGRGTVAQVAAGELQYLTSTTARVGASFLTGQLGGQQFSLVAGESGWMLSVIAPDSAS